MELKLKGIDSAKVVPELLIVLHGIETPDRWKGRGVAGLLIVLHGIET